MVCFRQTDQQNLPPPQPCKNIPENQKLLKNSQPKTAPNLKNTGPKVVAFPANPVAEAEHRTAHCTNAPRFLLKPVACCEVPAQGSKEAGGAFPCPGGCHHPQAERGSPRTPPLSSQHVQGLLPWRSCLGLLLLFPDASFFLCSDSSGFGGAASDSPQQERKLVPREPLCKCAVAGVFFSL